MACSFSSMVQFFITVIHLSGAEYNQDQLPCAKQEIAHVPCNLLETSDAQNVVPRTAPSASPETLLEMEIWHHLRLTEPEICI